MDQDLLNYLDRRFSSLDRRFDQVDQRFDGVDRRIDKLEEEIRGAYVLIEGLQSEVRLVAADGILNVTEQLNRHREDVARKFGEIESLNRSVFDEFRNSQERLGIRVSRLEATG